MKPLVKSHVERLAITLNVVLLNSSEINFCLDHGIIMYPNIYNKNWKMVIFMICYSAASLWSPQVQYQMLHRLGSHVFSIVWETAELWTPPM